MKRELKALFKPLVAISFTPANTKGGAHCSDSNTSRNKPPASPPPSQAYRTNPPPRLSLIPVGLMQYSNKTRSSLATAAKSTKTPANASNVPTNATSLPSPPRHDGSINRYPSRLWAFCLSGEDEEDHGVAVVGDAKHKPIDRYR